MSKPHILLWLFLKAFSKVVQKLVPQLPTLENLLNILITVSMHHNIIDFYCDFFELFFVKAKNRKC